MSQRDCPPSTGFARRRVLRTVGASIGVGALGSLAGCGGSTADEPESVYDYVPEPTNLRNESALTLLRGRPNELATASEVDDETVGRLGKQMTGLLREVPDLNTGTLERSVAFGPAAVGLGGFDRDAVATSLSDAGAERAGRHAGFDLYERDGLTFGLVDGELVVAEPSGDGDRSATDNAKVVLETSRGSGTRYDDADDDFALLVDEVGTSGVYALLRTYDRVEPADAGFNSLAGTVARGTTLSLDGSTATLSMLWVYADAASVDTGAVESLVDSQRNRGNPVFADADEVSITSEGRTATVTVTVAAAKL